MKNTCLLFLLATVSVILVPQSPLAERRGTNRPLSGSLTGAATILFGASECPGGVKTITAASGNLSHLGRVEALFSHCPSPPGSGLPYTNGRLTLIAANRDELWATYEDEDGQAPFVLDLKGGSGRFEDAEGTAIIDWEVQPMLDDDGNPNFLVPWPWWASIGGRISY